MDPRIVWRRSGLCAAYACAALLGLALLVAAGLTARLAVGSMSINVLGPSIRDSLNERLYYAYDVKFEDVRLSWSDGHGNLGVAMIGVRVADYSLQDIASVPLITVGLDLGAAIRGESVIAAVAVYGARVRWIETTGGAIKFDIGAENPGDSGKILEDFLITMAAAPDPSEGGQRSLPDIHILDSVITIGNERDGSSFAIGNADIMLEPDERGVRSSFAFTLETGTGSARIDAEGLYRTADQRIDLTARFAALDPHTLWSAHRSPLLQILPAEPLTGAIRFNMDRSFTVDAADFAFEGPTTAIEGRAETNAHAVDAHYVFALAAPPPSWPPALAPALRRWLAGRPERPAPITLFLAGHADRFAATLDLHGTIAPPETPFAVSGPAHAPIVSLR